MTSYRYITDTNDITLACLRDIIDTVPGGLRACPKEAFEARPAPDKWSGKEIIGHLIDSAANNHHRFVRAQYEDHPVIGYDQDAWNRCSHYSDMPGEHVISMWEMYNRHIIEVFSRIPEEERQKACRMFDGSVYSIAWLFDDYVRHIEHHLRQITGYGH